MYARMQLLQKIGSFNSNRKYLIHIYKTFVRSVTENSFVVWNSSLTQKNIKELEIIQKVAVKVILGNKFEYKDVLNMFNLPTMKERRQMLTFRFANKCVNNRKTSKMFEETINIH